MCLAYRTYAGIIRHTGLADARRLLISNLTGSACFVAANFVTASAGDGTYLIPFSIVGIEWLIASGAMISGRWFVKWLYVYNRRVPGAQTLVAIFGAGEAGLIAKHTIDRELGESSMRVVAFIDDDRTKVGKKLEGVDVFNADEAERLFMRGGVDRVILSIQNLSAERRRSMVDLALKHGVRPLDVPPVDKWINGELSVGQIRELNIEDLLGRTPSPYPLKPHKAASEASASASPVPQGPSVLKSSVKCSSIGPQRYWPLTRPKRRCTICT